MRKAMLWESNIEPWGVNEIHVVSIPLKMEDSDVAGTFTT